MTPGQREEPAPRCESTADSDLTGPVRCVEDAGHTGCHRNVGDDGLTEWEWPIARMVPAASPVPAVPEEPPSWRAKAPREVPGEACDEATRSASMLPLDWCDPDPQRAVDSAFFVLGKQIDQRAHIVVLPAGDPEDEPQAELVVSVSNLTPTMQALAKQRRASAESANARLVVVDPTDQEQVQKLGDAIRVPHGDWYDIARAALRAIAGEAP